MMRRAEGPRFDERMLREMRELLGEKNVIVK